ncbi:Bax inhibitor-1 family protein [Salinicoccus hispanicus]|uniref:Bax inhibitor-1 family protein n=1 Tax=Salinicoccus hispanicus TaxID=157225 RepID=UPI0036141A2D
MVFLNRSSQISGRTYSTASCCSVFLYSYFLALSAIFSAQRYYTLGRYLFIALLVVIFASLLNFFINLPFMTLALTIGGLVLYILFTMYDFNRMKNKRFSPREMGFNLFINLLIIIKRLLRLYRYINNRR